MDSTLRREVWLLSRSRGIVAGVFGACMLLAAVYNFGSRPMYQATTVISLDIEGMSPLRAGGAIDKERRGAALQDQIRILESKELALMALSDAESAIVEELAKGSLGSLQDRVSDEIRYRFGRMPNYQPGSPELVQIFRSRLVVESEPQATWVFVRLTGYDPSATARILNHFMDVYLQETKRRSEGAIEETKARVEQKVVATKERVIETLGQLDTVDKSAGLQNLETRKAFLEKEIARLQDALITARQNMLTSRILLDEAQRLPADSLVTLPTVRSDRDVATALDRVSDLETRMADLTSTLGERHPEVVSLRAELDQARKNLHGRLTAIKESTTRAYRVAAREAGDLSAAIENSQRELRELNQSSIERGFIQKQAEAGQRAAGELIAKSVREADDEVFFQPRVLQRAEPPTVAASPQKLRNFQYAAVLGLVLGLGIAWLRSHLDETLRTPEDVKASLGIPLVAMVPRIKAEHLDLLGPQTPEAARLLEAYRVLRTNLMLGGGTSDEHRVVLMTSSREAEGKTTTSCGLAVALARAGHRVLLVDGDLRRASLSHLLSFGGRSGFIEAIEGAPFERCIAPTTVPGLSVLPAGGHRDDAAELLTRDTVGPLFDRMRADFDWIICDAPPVLAVADATTLCRHASWVLVVIAANATPLGSIRATLDQLASVGARIRGLVLNNVDLSRDSHYYRHYYSSQYEYYSGRSKSAVPKSGMKPEAPPVPVAHEPPGDAGPGQKSA